MNNEALNEWMEDSTDINQIQAKVDKAMTPKEKAEELIKKYSNLTITSHIVYFAQVEHFAKQCALIAVDELIESFNSIYDASIRNIEKYSGAKYGMKDYWKEVKQEIEKL